MPTIVYIEHDGTEHRVDAQAGRSLMHNAVDNFVPGVAGDCGGCCSCATCHGHIDTAWLDRLPPPSDDETALLAGTLDVRADSRLTCQLVMSDALDGIVVRWPASQG